MKKMLDPIPLTFSVKPRLQGTLAHVSAIDPELSAGTYSYREAGMQKGEEMHEGENMPLVELQSCKS